MRLAKIIAALVAGLAVPASATVTYSFSYAAAGLSFVWNAPAFVTGTVSVPVAQLASCSGGILGGCGTQVFTPGLRSSGTPSVPHDVLAFGESGGAVFFYFSNNAFQTLGIYPDILFHPDATLTISDTAAVPEPAAWALLITGFGLTGTTLRRRRGFGYGAA